MLKNILKSSFKYLWKHKAFSLINLIGLSTALCVCYFVLLYVRSEFSYDSYHQKADNIYRLVTDIQTSGGIDYQSSSAPMGPAIQKAFPAVQESARVFLDYMLVQKDESNFSEEKLAYADPTIFSVFSFPLISGNPRTALDAPFKLIISESGARKYFGTTDVLNKTLILDGKYPAVIGGVMKDIPYNSHFRVDIIMSISTLLKEFNPTRAENWNLFGFYTYFVLPGHADIANLNDKFTQLVSTHVAKEKKYNIKLEPLKSVYLEGKPRGSRTGSSASGNIGNLYIFLFAAALVLIIACINFINLSTSFSLKRAKEIGLRKSLGATKPQLVFQFLLDSLLLSLMAFVVSTGASVLLLPTFNKLVDKIIIGNIFEFPSYLAFLLLLSVVVGLLSGLYPAFRLTRYDPVASLKGQFHTGTSGALIRKSLVICQFAISILIIITTIVVHRQLDYMQNKDLGYNSDNKLVIDFHFDDRLRGAVETSKSRLLELKEFNTVSFSSSVPGKPTTKVNTKIETGDQSGYDVEWDTYHIDYDFLKQYDVKLIAGRTFQKDFSLDSISSMIVNEAAVKSLGFSDPRDIIGKKWSQGNSHGTIVGVVRDFNFQSFREQIQPLVFRIVPRRFTFITLTGSPRNLFAGIDALQRKWGTLAPGLPLNYFFADDTFNEMYKSEKQFRTLVLCFAVIAILISSLGLLGLSAFSVAQRLKEITVRKIVGATSWDILGNLLIDLLKPVVIAMSFAIPLAWWLMYKWLENYAYRVTLSWSMFFLACVLSLSIAMLTILLLTVKAAIVNPARTLQNN